MHSTHRLTRLTLAPLLGLAALAALGLIAQPAAAQTTYFPNDATINYALNGDAFVGYNTGLVPSSPTVNVVRGGSISGILEVYNGSTVNVSGGAVSDILQAFNTCTVNVSSGSVGGFLYAINGSAFHVSGGTFGQSKGVNFVDSTTGAFTFLGSGLSYAPDPGGQTLLDSSIAYTDYTLTGLLLNGQSVTGEVIEVASGATMFTLTNAAPVPEASTAAPVGLGMLCLVGLMLAARVRAGRVGRAVHPAASVSA